MTKQLTDTILMVRPANFGYNAETAESNAFQQRAMSNEDPITISQRAREEFEELVKRLRAKGVNVIIAEDSPDPVKPDAVFPNNWLTFHEDGTVILYPMESPTRRLERRQHVMDAVFKIRPMVGLIDLTDAEDDGLYLEGTGSMVLDRVHHLAYACLSSRTSEVLLDEFCVKMGYKKVVFHATDQQDKAIYHTNVMMALGETFVVICMESVRSTAEQAMLERLFEKTGKEIITITLAQMNAFAGNMLQVSTADGEPVLAMSEQAYRSLLPKQVAALEKHTALLYSPIYTLEKYGGGSVRCMMAEVF